MDSTNNSKNLINSDNHVNRGCARSQGQGQGAPQLPSPNEVAQTTPNSVPQTMSNSVPQTMQTAQQTLGDEANTLAPEPNTLAQEPNTLAPQAVTFIGVDFLNHIYTSNNSDLATSCKHSGNRVKSCDELSRNSKLVTSSDLSNKTSRTLKNSLGSYDDLIGAEMIIQIKMQLYFCFIVLLSKKSCVNESIMRLYSCIFVLIYAKLRAYNLRSLVRSVGGHLDHNRRLVTSNDLTLRPLKNSLKSYDDSTIIKCIKIIPKSPIFARKSRKSFKKLFQKSEKSNRRIHSQIQDWTTTSRDINEFQNHREKLSKIKNRELPLGVVYFLTIFEHNFFSLNDHETDFSLVYHPPRACTTIPSIKRPPSCGVKEKEQKKSAKIQIPIWE
jgi:hypothetical protein